jgi:hypothetical protein
MHLSQVIIIVVKAVMNSNTQKGVASPSSQNMDRHMSLNIGHSKHGES